MKWGRAIHHLDALATSCAEALQLPFFDLRVTQLWTFGVMLGPPMEVDDVPVALAVDRAPETVAWLTEPAGASHWGNSVRLEKNPFNVRWRSDQAPVWNHEIVRPVLIWDATDGHRADALSALSRGAAEEFRLPAPTPEEYAARLWAEVAVCENALRVATEEYHERRWAPGKLTPYADRLANAALGYLDALPHRR